MIRSGANPTGRSSKRVNEFRRLIHRSVWSKDTSASTLSTSATASSSTAPTTSTRSAAASRTGASGCRTRCWERFMAQREWGRMCSFLIVNSETERLRDGETERRRDKETERRRGGPQSLSFSVSQFLSLRASERQRDGETKRLRDAAGIPSVSQSLSLSASQSPSFSVSQLLSLLYPNA